MIPQILELKNFMSYGDSVQRIDFKDHSLICLTGKNGHGKSALLDALTWALWGHARKISGAVKADEGLLRLGQTRMMVSLEFILSGQIYRVRREFTKTYGKPLLALDFDMFDAKANKFISLTEKTSRQTQIKIEQLLGLDYETFINSAFLRQGQSNEFSKKSSKERKHILASILGLTKYDNLQQLALEKIKNLNEEKRGILALHEHHTKELEKEPTLISQLTAEKNTLIACTAKLENLTKNLREQEKTRVSYQAQKQALISKQKDYQEHIIKLNESSHLIRQLIKEWKSVHSASLTLPDLKKLHAQKKNLSQHIQQMLELQQKSLSIHEAILTAKDAYQKRSTLCKNNHEKTLQQQRTAVHQHELILQQQKTIIEQRKQYLLGLEQKRQLLLQEKAPLEKSSSSLKDLDQQLTRAQQQFEKRKALYQTLIQRGNWAKNELAELTRKQKVIHDTNNPSCPLCEQLLTAKRKQFLAQQLIHNESFLQRRLQRISTLIKRLKELLYVQHEQLQSLKNQTEKALENSTVLNQIEKKIQEITHEYNAALQELASLEKTAHTFTVNLDQAKKDLNHFEISIQKTISNDAELKSIMQQLTQLEQERAKINFDAQALTAIQKQIADIETHIVHAENTHQALTQQNERKSTIRMLCKELKGIKKTIDCLDEQLKAMPLLEQKEQEISDFMQQLSTEISECSMQKEQLLHSIGSLEHEYNHLQKIKDLVTQDAGKIALLDSEIDDYQIIATTMSKNGIQALLIEEAIPEIEQEANAILARLTDNQAQIFIESLRDLKSGGVKETLDIQIADTAGIRPYEMYSGGEAFRVDFALRIAIAKLLARRAGTALQTLIIDEGFGSQDEDGLVHIMECLYAIQHDFSRIIIVSHLSEFKHNFPVHIIIEKGPTGSQVYVEERG